MKKNSIIFLNLMFLVLTACGLPKIFNKKTNHQQTNSIKNHLSYVKMHRTACFGRCPIYYIEIFDDGLLRYNGIRFVSDSGIFEKRIDASKVIQLLADFEKHRLDTLQETYENKIVDLPGVYFEFKIGDEEKQIKNAQFGPKFLRGMATEIDNFIMIENGGPSDKSWKKTTK